HYAQQLKGLITAHYKNTQSRFAERLLAEFDREITHFWQVVPREVLDKLEVPVTRDTVAALTARAGRPPPGPPPPHSHLNRPASECRSPAGPGRLPAASLLR